MQVLIEGGNWFIMLAISSNLNPNVQILHRGTRLNPEAVDIEIKFLGDCPTSLVHLKLVIDCCLDIEDKDDRDLVFFSADLLAICSRRVVIVSAIRRRVTRK